MIIEVGASIFFFMTPYSDQKKDGSYIELLSTDNPGCPYKVEFVNKRVHPDDSPRYKLALEGFSVEVPMVVGHGETPDHFKVIPPKGYVSIPVDGVNVPEDATGEILICKPMY